MDLHCYVGYLGLDETWESNNNLSQLVGSTSLMKTEIL